MFFGFVTYLGWRRTVRAFFDVNFGNLSAAEKRCSVRLGVSEMPSKSYRGNFVGLGGGSLGMRRVKMADSPFLGRDLKRRRAIEFQVSDL